MITMVYAIKNSRGREIGKKIVLIAGQIKQKRKGFIICKKALLIKFIWQRVSKS